MPGDREPPTVPVVRPKGSPLPGSDLALRRVAIHAGAAVADVALPAGVPVAVLMPSIVDILGGRGNECAGELVARRYRLSRPGAAPLGGTLAQNGIQDGEVLVLTDSADPPPAPRYADPAEAVAATLDSTARPWSHSRQATRLTGAIAAIALTGIGALALIRNAFSANVTGATLAVTASAALGALIGAAIAHRTYGDAFAGLALSLIATAFAAVAGCLAVPGAPGLPSVVLGATAAVVASMAAMRASGCGVITLTAVSCAATIIAAAALAGVITAAPPRVIGSVSASVSLGLLGVAARVSIVLAGLSPQRPPAADLDAKAIRADTCLTSLLAAFASVATVGAVVTVLGGAPRPQHIAVGALTGAALLLRARSGNGTRRLVFVACGTVITATTFAVVAAGTPHGAWTAALTAALAAAAMHLGFVAAAISTSPLIRRGVDALEGLTLVAMVPATCWVCGLYSAARGWHLG
ncbi:type VII secretion integral membrane protein EccD [Mycobacterium sp. E2699]|nr:type VII secretion integral membrane protein EccD [Mycobacterium sp. E2699]